MTEFAEMIDGYRRFRANGYEQQHERWETLAEGQSPKVMVIACSDSRIDPSIVFDAGPGEMFVVRNVANLVPPFEVGGLRHGVSAALEFAVTQLKVSEIVVMGHGSCGGVKAALERPFENAPPGKGGFIADWMHLLDEARARVVADNSGADAIRALELECVKVSLANLRSFPCVPVREAAGRLRLRGAYFAIADGRLHLLDEESGTFAPAG